MIKTHVIDGVTYVEVTREAEVGETVVIIDNTSSGFKEGYIGDVTSLVMEEKAVVLDRGYAHYHEDYRVLEPLDSNCLVDTITDLLANLANRVHSLEQQLRDTQGNCEKLAEELANVKYNAKRHIENLTCDIVTLDERSQVLNAINKFYEEGSR